MKKIFIVSLVICTTFFACKNDINTTEKASETKIEITHLKSDSLKIEFDFPKTWTSIKNPEQKNLITLKQPLIDSSDNFQENVLIWTEQLPMNISDSIYHLTTIAQLKITNPNLDIKSVGKKQIGDKQFYEYSFEFTPADSNKYIVNGYTYINTKDSMGYNFNATAEANNKKLFQTEIEQLISTFKTR